jgi:hypothetical protein
MDPGNYTKKIQPEKGITLDNKLSIKAIGIMKETLGFKR